MAFLRVIIFFFLLFTAVLVQSDTLNQPHILTKLPVGVILEELAAIGYSGKERLSYDVSWTGGIKIGELHMEINAIPEVKDGYEIRAYVTTKNGAVHFIYPIRDLHVTRVKGKKKLPYHYEVWQKEGYSYEAHSVYEYNQATGTVRYEKNGRFKKEYTVDGEINNEFSSFFNSRLMQFAVGENFIVSTFADKKKVDVEVAVTQKKRIINKLVGDVMVAEIFPILKFKGLYDKKGDTVIWYSDDECRVPIRVNSKIVIGSLTAELSSYSNMLCRRYSSALSID